MLEVRDSLPVVELEGTAYEQGRQHGEALAERIRRFFAWECEARLPQLVGQPARVQAYTNKFIPYIAEYAPDLLEEMRGIADGAGLTLADVVQLNSFLDLADARVPATYARLFRGCTCLAVNRDASADDCTYVAQTYDVAAYFQPALAVLRLPTPGGGQALVQTFAGVLGCSGVNSHGLAVVINNLCGDDGKPGVPYPVVLRQILNQPRLGDAIGTALGLPRASGMNYLMGNAEDIVDVETSATAAELTYADEGYLYHTNHFVTARLKDHDLAPVRALDNASWASTYGRSVRARRRLGEAVRGGKVTRAQLWEILSDHADWPVGICNHEYETPGGPGPRGTASASALVLAPKTGDMYITDGNPCQAEARRYSVSQSTSR